VRDRGVLFAALDCYDFATRDLETYSPAPQPRKEELTARIAVLRQKASRLN
jgi:regulator of sirC expression with transglutaminase-like and TPR domain